MYHLHPLPHHRCRPALSRCDQLLLTRYIPLVLSALHAPFDISSLWSPLVIRTPRPALDFQSIARPCNQVVHITICMVEKDWPMWTSPALAMQWATSVSLHLPTMTPKAADQRSTWPTRRCQGERPTVLTSIPFTRTSELFLLHAQRAHTPILSSL
jgi:hypothetical protein